jgi:MFS family permease
VGAEQRAATVAGPLFGKAGDVYGRRAVLQVALVVVLGASLAAAGLVVLTGLAHRTGPSILTGGMLLLGCGLGLLLPTLGLLTQAVVHRAHLGAGVSVIMLLRTLGGAIGTAVAGSLVAARLAAAPTGATSSFAAGFPALAAAAVPAVVIAPMMRHTLVPGLGPRHRALGPAS